MTKFKFSSLSENNKIVIKNTFFAFLIKGGALLISLLTTPAFIRYFNNNEILGVWYTILSVLAWFLNFDLGIGNGVRNNLVEAFSNNDKKEARHIISSGLFSVLAVSVILSIIGISFISLFNLNKIFNIDSSVISQDTLFLSAAFVFVAIMLRFCLTTISSIFYALQKSAMNNFLALVISILQLVFVLTIRFQNPEKSLIVLSAAYLIISNLPVVIAGVVLFCGKLKDCRPSLKYVDKKHIKMVLKIGGIFFLCQILYMFIVNTNEFLVTYFFGPENTTLYTFYYKTTDLVSMAAGLAMTPIWSVVTKAVTEKDWYWINRLYSKIKKVGILVIIFEFALVPFLQIIMNIWLQDHTFKINYLIAISFACFGSVFVYSSMLSTIVCGMARMKLQAICYGVGVVFKLLFVLIMSHFTNEWNIIVWSNVILLLPYCILQQIDLNKYINKQMTKPLETEQ